MARKFSGIPPATPDDPDGMMRWFQSVQNFSTDNTLVEEGKKRHRGRTENTEDYTVSSEDAGKVIILSGSTNRTFTIGADTMTQNDRGRFRQEGTGVITIIGAEGTNLRINGSLSPVTNGQFAEIEWEKISPTEILLTGQLGGAFTTTANDYDGTNDFALRGSDLTGAVDGKAGTASFWIRLDGGDGSLLFTLGHEQTNGLSIGRQASGDKFFVIAQNVASSVILNQVSTTSYTVASPGGWIHVIISWDLATPEVHMFINDVDDAAIVTTLTDDTIDYTLGEFAIGSNRSGTQLHNGCFSEIWFEDTFIDISVNANRRKFITSGLKAVDLGTDGSTPTGASPLIYAPDGDPSDNKGTGGNFVITGTLTACSDSPND